MNKKLSLFFKGIVDIMPLLIPVIPFGIILGAIGIELGFTPLETFATSFIIFGGASQIIFLQLLSGGASSLITITSTFVVNSRHLLYGASLSGYLNKLSLSWRILLSYLLTDQAYAVSNDYFKKIAKHLLECILTLPEYPRAEGAQLGEAVYTKPGHAPMKDEDARPFAGLASLKDQLKFDPE